jgi:hypothetical protein
MLVTDDVSKMMLPLKESADLNIKLTSVYRGEDVSRDTLTPLGMIEPWKSRFSWVTALVSKQPSGSRADPVNT